MATPLERAQKALQFEDIFQQATDSWLAEDFEPRTSPATFRMQMKHQVVQSNLLTFSGENDDDGDAVAAYIFRVRIDTGVRLVNGEEQAEETSPCAQIEATYHIDYRVTNSELIDDQEALDAFALSNAGYHLWPYWREYAMSQAQRMNLPKVPVPMRMPTLAGSVPEVAEGL